MPHAFIVLSFMAFRLEATDALVSLSAKAVDADPKDEYAFNNRAYGYLLEGDLVRAEKDIDRSLAINADFHLALNNRGLLKIKRMDLDGALADVERSMTIDTTFPEAYLNRGYIHASRGDHIRAVADFTKAIELRPWLRLAFDARATSRKKLGKSKEAAADEAESRRLAAIIAEARKDPDVRAVLGLTTP